MLSIDNIANLVVYNKPLYNGGIGSGYHRSTDPRIFEHLCRELHLLVRARLTVQRKAYTASRNERNHSRA